VETLGKFFAAICAVLFVVSAVIVLLLFNIERKAFSSETYKQAFEEQKLYERMPALLASTLTTYIAENPNAIPLVKALTVENWQASLTILLPPDELKALANNALDSTFDYLNGKTDSAVISLAPIKTHLAGESGLQVVKQFLGLQPPCTVEQLTQMAAGLLGGQIGLCNPPEEAMGFMAPFIQAQLQSITTLIPNQAEPSPLSHKIDALYPDPIFVWHRRLCSPQSQRAIHLVGLAVSFDRDNERIGCPGWLARDRMDPSATDPNSGNELYSTCSGTEHRRGGQRGRAPDARAGCDRGIYFGNCGIGNGHPGHVFATEAELPDRPILNPGNERFAS
jgi:hypothetical protein